MADPRMAELAAKYEAKLSSVIQEFAVEAAAVSKPLSAPSTPTHHNKHGDRRVMFHEKVFVDRESLLSQMLSSGDESYRAIYHAMIATLIWLGVKLMLQDYYNRGIFIDFAMLAWSFDKFDAVMRIWVGEITLALTVLPLVQYVKRSREPSVALKRAVVVYVILQCSLICFASWKAVSHGLAPASGLIVMCEGVRLSLKMHAYLREKLVHGLRRHLEPPPALSQPGDTVPSPPPGTDSKERGTHAEETNGGAVSSAHQGGDKARRDASVGAAVRTVDERSLYERLVLFADHLPAYAQQSGVTLATLRASQPHITIADINEEIGRYIYFVFCPTLVYRDNYPRNAGPINWLRAGVHAFNLAAVVLYTYVITRSLLVPLLAPVLPKHPIDIVMLVQGAMVPAILVFLLSFFGILHSWLNLWAELLRFSDRQFYSSWWTATSWSAYYRRWNQVVGDWLHSYVYNDLQRAGMVRSKAEAGVFIASAFIHELILACAFRFFYPALFLMFGGPGVAFMNLTRKFAARFANVFMWLMLSVGLGLLTVMYSRELYARYGYEWQGLPGIPQTPPYLYNPDLHPSPDWNTLNWISYIFIPRSWIEFWKTYYA